MGMQEHSFNKPYIGITGVAQTQEAKAIAEAFAAQISPACTHEGMVGYLVSQRTLEGEAEKYAKYPPLCLLPSLLEATKSAAFNTIHYRAKDKSTLDDQIVTLFKKHHLYDEGLCRGLQLNMSWPDVGQIERIKQEMPELKLILPLTGHILRSNSRPDIAHQLQKYAPFCSYILLDPSGGWGRSFRADSIAPFYRVVRGTFPCVPVILAGGFNDRNVSTRLGRLQNRLYTKEFGIDAENGLRDYSSSESHGGELSTDKSIRYIKEAVAFYRD